MQSFTLSESSSTRSKTPTKTYRDIQGTSSSDVGVDVDVDGMFSCRSSNTSINGDNCEETLRPEDIDATTRELEAFVEIEGFLETAGGFREDDC